MGTDDGSAETIARNRPSPGTLDPFQTTERDERSSPRVPDGLPSTFADGTLLYESGESQLDDSCDAKSLEWAGRLPRVAGYDILGELGRGGMGVVYKARRVLLNRPCALKMILLERSHDPDAIARFLAEARTVARLRHPHIVEIYSIGHCHGRPYLELEIVDGGSLAVKLEGTPQPVGYAAELVETLARAIEAAHRAGVIHRDLKPGNVLLTRDGTPKITDFGLAKVICADSEMTRTHSIMGSPCYMAPEQAGGKSRQVGPPTDVYSLGAILYELLTGRPPFKAESLEETLDLVRTADPVPPSRLRPSLPADLETICLTCLRKEPSARYASAAALAEDLERFRTGRAIRARRPGLIERGIQWLRRNPSEARLVQALAVVVVVALIGLSALWVRAERLRGLAERRRYDAERHLAEANRQRVEAVRNLLEARAAVDEYLGRIGGSAALRSPALRPLRRELLHAAVAFHRRFLTEHGDDPNLRAELAAAQLRLARVNEELLDKPAAEGAYRAALAGYEELARTRPDDDQLHEGIADSLFGLACCQLDRPEAKEPLARAIAIRAKLAGRRAAVSAPRLKLAEAYQALAARHRGAGENDEALRTLLKVREIAQELVRDFPNDPVAHGSLGTTLHELAVLHRALQRPRDALDLGQQALPHLRIAFLRTELNPWYGGQLAATCGDVGAMHLEQGQDDEALRSYQEASRVRRRVAQANPAVAAAHSDLIAAELELSRLYGKLGRADEEAAALRRAQDVVDGLPREGPGELYVIACVHALNSARAGPDEDRRRREADAAVAALRRALAAGWRDRSQIREDPDLSGLRDREDFRALTGEPDPGGETASLPEQWHAGELALAERERLANDDPKDIAKQADLAAAHRSLGLIQLRLGQLDPGLDSLQGSIAITERLVTEEASSRQARIQLARDLGTLAEELWRADWWKASRNAAGRSLQVWEQILREAPGDPAFPAEAAAVRAGLARAVFQTGQFDETRRLFHQARRAFETAGRTNPRVAFEKARVFALASEWQPGLGVRDREDLADGAIRAIQDALATGYRDDGSLAELPAFDPLRRRPEFGDILLGWTSQGGVANHPPGRTERIITDNQELLAVQEALVRKHPGNSRYRSALARTHATLGDAYRSARERAAAVRSHRHAVQLCEALAAERPEDPGVQADLARSLIALALDHAEVGLWEEAAEWIDRSLAIRLPEQPEIWSYAILLRTLRGDEAGARELSERQVARFEGSEHPLVATILARSSALLSRPGVPADRLERFGRAAIATYPDQAWVRFVAGLVHYRLGQFDGAESELRTGLEVAPAWPAIAVNWTVLAMTAQQLGRDEEARTWLRKADRWWEDTIREVRRRREFRLPIPWWDFAELEILLREARSVVTGADAADEAERWRLRARGHSELADPEGAAVALRRACELRPDDPSLRIDFGRALIAAGHGDEADAAFRRAIAVRPAEAEVRIHCGRAWADFGQGERGATYFDEAVALEPEAPAARVARGRFLAECGQAGRAEADFARAAELARDNLSVFLDGWWIAGPYPDASEPGAAPEPSRPLLASGAEGTREVPWRFLADGDVEPAGLVEGFRHARHVSAYAMNYLYSTRDRDVTLLLTCDNSARLWLNGRLIREAGPFADRHAPRRVPVTLRKGRNLLLARVANGLGDPRLSCRVEGGPPPVVPTARRP
jgi:serine/threonine-protein kinase